MYTFQWLCTLLVLSGASVLATQLGDSSDLVLRDGEWDRSSRLQARVQVLYHDSSGVIH
jgi:hypothetical protein